MAEHRGKQGAALNEDADGCDLDFTAELTGDADLPPASGGVQQAAVGKKKIAAHDHSDGCDLNFADGALTKDDDLPAATGG